MTTDLLATFAALSHANQLRAIIFSLIILAPILDRAMAERTYGGEPR